MIYYILRSPLSEDPRMQKYILACQVGKVEYKILSWDRLCNAKNKDVNEIQFVKYMPYGCGKQNIPLLILWSLFVEYHLLKDIFKYKVIHAVNFENYILAFPLKLFGKKVILDIYDSSMFSSEPKAASKCDLLILPHERRLARMGLTAKQVNNLMIVENTPVFKFDFPEKGQKRLSETIHLSYVGTFEKDIRGIENVLDVVYNDTRFTLDIAGSGAGLEEQIKEYANKCSRIHYFGRVEYRRALEIMYNSDFIVALYYLKYGDGHKWACPNKICESLFLSTPVITTKGTLAGADVEAMNTGYVVADSKEDFLAVFDNFETQQFIDDYNMKLLNCKSIWDEKYSNYFEDVLFGQYLTKIKQL